MQSNVPYKMNNDKLTGRTRYRIGKEKVSMFSNREVLVLQVEVEYEKFSFDGRQIGIIALWEDARVQDFSLDVITSL